MAGSFEHIVNDKGSLLNPKQIQDILDTTSGDVAEAIEEMYGIIWYLAHSHWVESNFRGMPESYISDAQNHYREGLAMSPTPRYRKN